MRAGVVGSREDLVGTAPSGNGGPVPVGCWAWLGPVKIRCCGVGV